MARQTSMKARPARDDFVMTLDSDDDVEEISTGEKEEETSAAASTKKKAKARIGEREKIVDDGHSCLLYTSPSPRDLSTSRMPSSA